MIKIKFFLDPIASISPWLNKISSKGYRLASVNNFIYKFENADEKFTYTTTFIGANSVKQNRGLVDLLEDSNTKTFRAPLNQGNIAFGKMRVRPYVKDMSKIATTFGDFNKEILIIENKGEEIETFLSDNCDIAMEYKSIRNAYLQGLIGLTILVGLLLYKNMGNLLETRFILKETIAIAAAIYLFTIITTANNNYKKYKELSNVIER